MSARDAIFGSAGPVLAFLLSLKILFESLFMLGFVWFGVHILASCAERKALQTVSSLLTFNGQLKVF